MNRLTSGLVSSLALLLAVGCSSEPTGDLTNGEVPDRLVAKPSEFVINQGDTRKIIVGALDAQGNQLSFDYQVGTVGAGLAVERDFSYLPIFVGDGPPGPPIAAPEYQFLVTANDLVSTSFTITAGGKEVSVPVIVVPNPLANVQLSVTASASGPSAQNPITLAIAPPYVLQGSARVSFDVGDAVVVGGAADGSTLDILALPGSTGPGAVAGVALGYAPTLPAAVTATTDPIAVDLSVTPIAGTDAAATAPPIEIPASGQQTGFIDAGNLAAADCGQNSGAPCQLYKFSLAEDTDLHVRLQGSNAADLGLYFLNADDGSDADAVCDDLARDEVPEECDLSFTAGNYLMAVVSFGPFYPTPTIPGGPDPNPDWVAVQVGAP